MKVIHSSFSRWNFLFVCFMRPLQATEKVGGMGLPLFTAVGTFQLPVGLWHGTDWGYVCFVILRSMYLYKAATLSGWVAEEGEHRSVPWSGCVPVQNWHCQNQEKQELADTLHRHEQPLPPCTGLSQPQAKAVCPTSPWQPGDTRPGPTMSPTPYDTATTSPGLVPETGGSPL